jgi:hypothetical protein
MTRLLLTLYVFSCDAHDCGKDSGEITPQGMTNGARSAWRIVRLEGWTRHGDKHLCPDHRA